MGRGGYLVQGWVGMAYEDNWKPLLGKAMIFVETQSVDPEASEPDQEGLMASIREAMEEAFPDLKQGLRVDLGEEELKQMTAGPHGVPPVPLSEN